MPSPRVIIAVVGAVLGVVVFYATRSSYASSTWPRVYALTAFILVYVVGNILSGVVDGMREASEKNGDQPHR